MSANLIITPGATNEGNNEGYQYKILSSKDDVLTIWLTECKISQDGIDKISKNYSFKEIELLLNYTRSLTEELLNELKLNIRDKIKFLQGIEDLRNNKNNKDNDCFEKQIENINKTFNQIINHILNRKIEIETMLKKEYVYDNNSKFVVDQQKLNSIIDDIKAFGSIENDKQKDEQKYQQEPLQKDEHKHKQQQEQKQDFKQSQREQDEEEEEQKDSREKPKIEEKVTPKETPNGEFILSWNKVQRGLNVDFINDYKVKTGEFVTVITDKIISCCSEQQHFLYEIQIEKIAKDSTFIGYIDGNNNNNLDLNKCLTSGKSKHSTQFAIAFNKGTRSAHIYGMNKKRKQIKLYSSTRNGDKFMFHIDFETNTVNLYQNNRFISCVFVNVPHNIIPAVSGRGGIYRINTIQKDSAVYKSIVK